MKFRVMSAALALLAGAVLATRAGAQCEVDELSASDAAPFDELGYAVSVSGNTALVGARYGDDAVPDSGSAYVFEEQGTAWVETARLTASDAATLDNFGSAVSISGDTALVGAYQDDDAGSSSGSAYVFEKQGALWVETAKLAASDAAAGDWFGYAVSLSGDRALIGARHDDDAGPDSGSAYVFEKQGALWVETAKLTASDADAIDQFGDAVSLSGDTALVGAHLDDDVGFGSGSAYVFEKQGAVWAETAKLTAIDGSTFDQFGEAVSVSGDLALIGARTDFSPGTDSGSVYVFEKQGAAWVWTTKLIPFLGSEFDYFGSSVSVSGDTAVVGAYQDDDAGSSSGSAWLFEKQGAVWIRIGKLTASDPGAFDEFGFAVSVSGDTTLVGARFADDAVPNSGSAYVFRLSGPCLTGPTPGTAAAVNTVAVSKATFSGLVGLGYGLAVGSTPVGAACPGLLLELANPMLVGLTTADTAGNASFTGFVPPGFAGTTVFLQAVDVSACEVSHLVSHTFP